MVVLRAAASACALAASVNFANAQPAQENAGAGALVCFRADQVRKITELDFLDRVSVSPNASFVVVQKQNSTHAKLFSTATGARRDLKKLNGALLNVVRSADGSDSVTPLRPFLAPKGSGESASLSSDFESPFGSAQERPLAKGLEISRQSLGASELTLRSPHTFCIDPSSVQTSQQAAFAVLMSLSRPAQVFNERDFTRFIGLLSAGIAQKYPSQTLAALHGLLYYSGALYEAVLQRYPELSTLAVAPDVSTLTMKERKAIRQRVKEYVSRKVNVAGGGQLRTVEDIAPLVSTYFTESEKQNVMETIAYAATETAASMAAYETIFSYKLWAFTYNAAGNLFHSKDGKNFTDVSLSRSQGGFELHLLDSEPIAGAPLSTFGFYTEIVRQIPFYSLHVGTNEFAYEWTHAGRRYRYNLTARLDPQKTTPATEQNASTSFPSPAGQLRGLVAISDNMDRSMAASTRRAYVRYFRHHGFSFTSPIRVKDSRKLLISRITGKNAVHYLIKEAHADGHENRLFDLAKSGLLIRGRKGRGRESERIEILYPLKRSVKDADLKNSEFGELLKQRSQRGTPPLIYINASCWSVDKAIFEMNQSQRSELDEIVSTNPLNLFEDKKDNAGRVLLEGVRHNDKYTAIRSKLRNDAEYASGDADGFLFPDQRYYKLRVDDQLDPRVQTHSSISVRQGGQWKRYVPNGY